MSARDEDQLAALALDTLTDAVNKLPTLALQMEFWQLVGTAAILSMRSQYGNEFARGFLDGARADIEQEEAQARSSH